MTETESRLEARLRRLEDLEEIRQLFVDYGHFLDLGDYAAYARLFGEDGELMLGPIGRAKGRQEIETMMAASEEPAPSISSRAPSSPSTVTRPSPVSCGRSSTGPRTVPRSWVWWAITRTNSSARPGAGDSGVDSASSKYRKRFAGKRTADATVRDAEGEAWRCVPRRSQVKSEPPSTLTSAPVM